MRLSRAARVTLGTVTALINATFTQQPVEGLGAGLGMLLAVALILQAIQLPLYFALGFQRARLINLALLFGTAALVYLTANQIHLPQDRSWSLPMLLGCAVLAAAACYGISALVSYHWYRRREF